MKIEKIAKALQMMGFEVKKSRMIETGIIVKKPGHHKDLVMYTLGDGRYLQLLPKLPDYCLTSGYVATDVGVEVAEEDDEVSVKLCFPLKDNPRTHFWVRGIKKLTSDEVEHLKEVIKEAKEENA